METQEQLRALSFEERDFLNALQLYLTSRGTALRSAFRIRAYTGAPASTVMADLRVHYSNYFSNLMSAVELLRDSGFFDSAALIEEIEDSLQCRNRQNGRENYSYIRELRNAIIHRGLDVSRAIDFRGRFPLLIAQDTIWNRDRTQSFNSFSRTVIGLIERCEAGILPVIQKHLHQARLLEKLPDQQASVAEYIRDIQNSTHYPEPIKRIALANPPDGAEFVKVWRDHVIPSIRETLKPLTVVIPNETAVFSFSFPYPNWHA